MAANDAEIWIYGKTLADALRRRIGPGGAGLSIAEEQAFNYFDIPSIEESKSLKPFKVCLTRRLIKEAPGRWYAREDSREFRFRHQGKVFDVIRTVLYAGIGTHPATKFAPSADALQKNKDRALQTLEKVGADCVADYLRDAIEIKKKDGTVSVSHLLNSGSFTIG
ncbi:MAG: hypothetical protein KZQ90_11605 [Candidatus Thiodiazotropha sp. (ex Codakia rugifera)]|nr:hypothetical protein [Candidatus Thiodiazotropha sp. (ex Codakia rugifera)]